MGLGQSSLGDVLRNARVVAVLFEEDLGKLREDFLVLGALRGGEA